jgi:hypothetical protein
MPCWLVRLDFSFDFGEGNMLNARRLPAVAVMLSALGIQSPVAAQAFELTGAWASQTDLCTPSPRQAVTGNCNVPEDRLMQNGTIS